MSAVRHRGQRGQGLLLVLLFLAAFLLLIWTSLTLASSAFLGLGAVQADTRTTYALDAGIAYGIEQIIWAGNNCAALNPAPVTLGYPSGNIVATVVITPAPGCNASLAYNLSVTATGTSHTARAYVDQNQNGNGNGQNPLELVWELYR